MKMTEAARLREKWGDKPCNHPDLEKEYSDQGWATGDWVCTDCGEAGWGSDWNRKQSGDDSSN